MIYNFSDSDYSLNYQKSMGKKLWSNIFVRRFLQSIDSMYREKMEQILLVYGLFKGTVTTIMILYKNMKAMAFSLDGDFFDIVAGVLQRDT